MATTAYMLPYSTDAVVINHLRKKCMWKVSPILGKYTFAKHKAQQLHIYLEIDPDNILEEISYGSDNNITDKNTKTLP